MDFEGFAVKIVKEAGKILMENYGKVKSIRVKGGNWHELLTNVDMESNNLIIRMLKGTFPEHNIISEESRHKKTESEYTWYVDPLDGTTNYSMEVPFFCVALGLVKNREIILGVVYNPATRELFIGKEGKKSTLNGRVIRVSINQELKKTVVNYCHLNVPKEIEKIGKLFTVFKESSRDLRRLGSGNLDLCYLACGRNDVYIHTNNPSYDLVGGSIIAKGAGARITDWDNKPWGLESKNLLVTNGKLHKEVLDIIKNKNQIK